MERSQLAKVVNDPIVVTVGGADKSTPKDVEMSEPSLDKLGEHLSYITAGLGEILSSNQDFLKAAWNDPSTITAEHAFRFGSFPQAMKQIIADVVGESLEWVGKEMTGRQTVLVLNTYLGLIGWDFIYETFTQAWRNWSAAAAATVKTDPKPPRSVAQ